jgi:hypothetical protein
MADKILSPLLQSANRVATQATQQVSQQVSALSTAAHNRVTSEWQQFEKEAAKTEEWKVQAERSKSVAAAAAASSVPAPGEEVPAPRRLVFSIDDDFDDDALAAGPSAAVVPQSTVPHWQPRLDALMTIVEQESSSAARAAADAADVAAPRMPPDELLLQLKQLREEIVGAAPPSTQQVLPCEEGGSEGLGAGSGGRDGGAPAGDAAGGALTPVAVPGASGASGGGALEAQLEALSAALAKAQLEIRSKKETHRRQVEALEARVAAEEAEKLERMQLVAQYVEAEGECKRSVQAAEEELAAVRNKAGTRLKALLASNKALEEDIARLKEVDEMNRSKMQSLEASLHVVEGQHQQSARAAQSEAAKQQEDYQYARALVLRYLELEDQHEALFPALATAFKLTQQEVQRIQQAQQRHAKESSLWGRALWAGSRLAEAAKEVGQVASEQASHRR